VSGEFVLLLVVSVLGAMAVGFVLGRDYGYFEGESKEWWKHHGG
jgi:hypothetical protein